MNARNDAGLTAGWYFDSTKTEHGFVLQGSSMTPITDTDAEPAATATRPTGINRWNTIVGQYGSKKYGDFWEGFKRFSDGSVVAIVYPGPGQHIPTLSMIQAQWLACTTTITITNMGSSGTMGNGRA